MQVVDPTDEAAVAEALLDILTHPTKWEEMSKNGALSTIKSDQPRWQPLTGRWGCAAT